MPRDILRSPRVVRLMALVTPLALARARGEIQIHSQPYTLPPALLAAQTNTVPITTEDAVSVTLAIATKSGAAQVGVHVNVTQPSQLLVMVAALFAPNAVFITGQRGELDLALKSQTFKRLRKSGLTRTFALHAAPGTYRLRVVVQDLATGALSAFNRDLRVP